MAEMTVRNSAKINLALDVTGVLPNGYHSIESVFQTVGLYDEVSAELTDSGISISCEVPEKFAQADPIPCDERNIAYKAAVRFFDAVGLDCGCRIHIVKGIPSQAGMGGGSTDAAAVLFILNRLTGEKLSLSQLAEIGAKIGADVPFFLTGGTAYVCGIGEKITPIADFSDRILVIAKGDDGVSTAEAYRNIDALKNPAHPNTSALVKALEDDSDNAYKFFGNLFEEAVKLDSVSQIKNIMLGNNALSSVMTGSGSAVFGLFEDTDSADKCAEILRNNGFFAQVCRTVRDSFIIL